MKNEKNTPKAKTTPEKIFQFQTKDGEPFDIPIEGSLGVLALGDLGLIAWRQKRRQFKQELAERTQQHFQNQQT